MGREVKRVPMGFNWPINKIWEGYLNPHYERCPDCANGYTAGGERLLALVRLTLLSGADSLRGRNHPYFTSRGGVFHGEAAKPPGKDMADLSTGLAGRAPSLLGHDAVDAWVAYKKIVAAAGLDPKVWGICKTCKGSAVSPSCIEAYEAWRPQEPPDGEGWQMWETVTEGSPISPVFETPEELAHWMADHPSGAIKGTYEDWLATIRQGWAPSFVVDSRGVRSGVEAASNVVKAEKP